MPTEKVTEMPETVGGVWGMAGAGKKPLVGGEGKGAAAAALARWKGRSQVCKMGVCPFALDMVSEISVGCKIIVYRSELDHHTGAFDISNNQTSIVRNLVIYQSSLCKWDIIRETFDALYGSVDISNSRCVSWISYRKFRYNEISNIDTPYRKIEPKKMPIFDTSFRTCFAFLSPGIPLFWCLHVKKPVCQPTR